MRLNGEFFNTNFTSITDSSNPTHWNLDKKEHIINIKTLKITPDYQNFYIYLCEIFPNQCTKHAMLH